MFNGVYNRGFHGALGPIAVIGQWALSHGQYVQGSLLLKCLMPYSLAWKSRSAANPQHTPTKTTSTDLLTLVLTCIEIIADFHNLPPQVAPSIQGPFKECVCFTTHVIRKIPFANEVVSIDFHCKDQMLRLFLCVNFAVSPCKR